MPHVIKLNQHIYSLLIEKECNGFTIVELRDELLTVTDKYQDIDMAKEELVLENGKIQDGAAAMMAFGKMQFTEMDNKERSSLVKALLQYCELDTLAMLMIYEHWKSLK